MGSNEEYFRNKQIVAERKKRSAEKYDEESKGRLKKITKKNMQTIMIAALDEFEKQFGDMWGHGLDPSELDEEQLATLEEWKFVREQILNRGNSKIRATMDEVDQYTVHWNRHQYKFIVKTEEQNNEN